MPSAVPSAPSIGCFPNCKLFLQHFCFIPNLLCLLAAAYSRLVFLAIFSKLKRTKTQQNYSKTQCFLGSKLKKFAKTQFFGNSIALHCRKNCQKTSLAYSVILQLDKTLRTRIQSPVDRLLEAGNKRLPRKRWSYACMVKTTLQEALNIFT